VLAGFLRGWTDRLLMTVNDALLAFPGILLALAMIAVLGSSRHSIVLALAIAYLPATVRVVRSAVLSIREREYVEASKVAGDSRALHDVAPRASQRAAADHRAGDQPVRLGGAVGKRVELSWRRRAAAPRRPGATCSPRRGPICTPRPG
jgi:hypothetical protein